jgi:hypothetical protein
MLLSSCEGVSSAADILTRMPMSSGVGTCSRPGSGLGHVYYRVEVASAAPSGVAAIDLGTRIIPGVPRTASWVRSRVCIVHTWRMPCGAQVKSHTISHRHSAARRSHSGAGAQTFSACATRSACAVRVAGTPVAVTLNSAPAPRPLRGEGRPPAPAAAVGGSIGERSLGGYASRNIATSVRASPQTQIRP